MIVENNETVRSSNERPDYTIFQISPESCEEEKQLLSNELRRLRNDIVGSRETKKSILESRLLEKYIK